MSLLDKNEGRASTTTEENHSYRNVVTAGGITSQSIPKARIVIIDFKTTGLAPDVDPVIEASVDQTQSVARSVSGPGHVSPSAPSRGGHQNS